MLSRIFLLFICFSSFALIAGSADSTFVSAVSLFEIPSARSELAVEAEAVRAELEELPAFSETRQIDSYGFHGKHLPLLDELPESPRWTVTLSWGRFAKLEQVILVPAIDPRSGIVRSYGFPRRFRVLKEFRDGSNEVVAEWMEEDCPDLAHVPLRIKLSDPERSSIRIDVYRGAEESGMEFFALGEVFGVVDREVWQAKNVSASPEFASWPYWSKEYLVDQKTGLGMPLGSAFGTHATEHSMEVDRDFSIIFDESPTGSCWIDIDLRAVNRMGWLTLLPAKPPGGSIVPGYGFPGEIKLFSSRSVGGKTAFKPVKLGLYQGNPGDNSVRIPLYAMEARWLRLSVSDFAKHNGREIFALGEISISMREQVYPVAEIRLTGFPQNAESQIDALTDGLVSGQPELQMMEWFELIEWQHQLKQRLDEIILLDAAMEQRWSLSRQRAIITLVALLLLVLVGWAIYRQLSLQRLRLRIAHEQHQTEIEQMKLRFFTHISHELRTPLTVIPVPIERAMREVGEGKLRTYLGVALKNVRELQQLVEQILDLRQIQDGKMRMNSMEMELVVHLRSIIDSMHTLAEAKRIDLKFDPAVESLVVRLDPEAIKRILGNLIGNAIKFTPSGGRVVVRLAVLRRGIVLSVEDTGSGIAAEDHPNIFEQHYRGHSASAVQTHGSGLGLALVNEVVGLAGGKMEVESPVTDGHGSRFSVELPLQKGTNDE